MNLPELYKKLGITPRPLGEEELVFADLWLVKQGERKIKHLWNIKGAFKTILAVRQKSGEAKLINWESSKVATNLKAE